MKLGTLAATFAAGLFAASLTATPAAAFATIYTFGDSLVDAGNVFVATGGAVPSPAQGYFNGRFNNGYDFTDYLSIKLTGAPTAPSLIGGNNYAWGGARAIGPAYGGVQVPGIQGQLGAYLAASGGIGDANGLYVLNFGGNDVFGINSGDIGALTAAQATALVISEIVGAVTTLDAIGAGSILVMGIPNTDVTGLTIEFGLQAALDAVEPTLEADLYRFSYGTFYGNLLSNPTFYGFPPVINTTTSCRAAQPVVNGQIDCTGYFSFDGIHFTTQVHRAMTADLANVLGVPEPASWGLMIAGFGMVGAAMRRRPVAMAA